MRPAPWVLGVVAILAACAPGMRASLAPRDIGSVQAELALEHRVERRLQDVFGTDAENVRVAMDGARAIILGDVGQRPTQELATEVALTVAGVDFVSNRLRLVRKDRGGVVAEVARDAEDEAGDSALESEVKLRLVGEVGLWAGRIEVEAVEGVISLRGRVPDSERRDIALQTARRTGGVRKVIDLLRVEP